MPRILLRIATSFLIVFIGVFIKSYDARAQQTHRYTVISGQPPALVADAGEDIFSASGETVKLGGDPIASGGTLPYSYVWEPAVGLSNPEDANPEMTTGQSDATYTVTVTDAAGCTATDEATIFVDLTTSIMENREIPFTVYPNPAHSWLVIRSAKAFDGGTLTLLDPQGKQVLKELFTTSEQRLDTRSLSPGVYLLTLQVRQESYKIRIVIP